MHFYTAVLIFAGAAFTNAASIQGRQQAPTAACTAARNRIVSALEDADAGIERIQDPATASAAASALEQAQDGIQQIAAAIRAGQAPLRTRETKCRLASPPSARPWLPLTRMMLQCSRLRVDRCTS
ncbi:unnamed protein product [Parascedosporium putredinis]|uniref:Uncharacterized protein n=1 Tax=Parascedosporium putredinis TaxID=1442378 RepID=A0A9P1H3U2_9PEZI|nr:unnamed protein product [Parascedosporium putredinis]CAI7996131.1 unnamed protein product [Parascedosporium putredinis]